MDRHRTDTTYGSGTKAAWASGNGATAHRPGSFLPGKLTVAGLVAAGVGIVVQIAGGVDFPTIPPGLIIVLVAAGVVAFAPWRWSALVGTAVGVSQFAGLFLAGQGDRLTDPDRLASFTGIWVQLVGVTVTIVAGLVATMRAYSTRS